MADNVSKEIRSQIMSKVRSTGTGIEKTVKRLLYERELQSFEEHPSDVVGHPDVVFREEKIAIFVDSCFWHGCSRHLRMPSSKQEYWAGKIERNKKRDKVLRASLRKSGWHVVAIWEHELPDSPSVKRKLSLVAKLVSNRFSKHDTGI